MAMIAAMAILVLAAAGFFGPPSRGENGPPRLLYFTLSAGYRHEVIPASRNVMRQLGAASPQFAVTESEDVAVFTEENLRRYGAVMFFTTGELPMSEAQRAAFIDFVRRGGGFLGVHSATDTFYQWPEYGNLIGGYFDQHPWHQTVRIEVADRTDPLVSFLPPSIALNDEIYQIRDFDERSSHVLLRLDPASVDLTRENVHRHPYGWPLAWTRAYGKGRVFYTALGHEEGVWRDPGFQRMLRNAVSWAMGGSR
jgi:type 1 glutamine amidotransferase